MNIIDVNLVWNAISPWASQWCEQYAIIKKSFPFKSGLELPCKMQACSFLVCLLLSHV
jgi:hypothetical protein